MSNEEKILQMLEKLTEDVNQLKEDQATMKEDIATMQETLTRVAVTQENFVLPRLQVLTEGQVALRATLSPKEKTEKRLEVLESDMSTVKTVVRPHSEQLAALQKAQ